MIIVDQLVLFHHYKSSLYYYHHHQTAIVQVPVRILLQQHYKIFQIALACLHRLLLILHQLLQPPRKQYYYYSYYEDDKGKICKKRKRRSRENCPIMKKSKKKNILYCPTFYSWRGGVGKMTAKLFSTWFFLIFSTFFLSSTFNHHHVMAKLANNDTMSIMSLGSHYVATQQSENFISCHFNPLCFCKYDQKTEIYDSVRRLWQMVGFNQTNFFSAVRSLLHHMKHEPSTIYYITETELTNFAWLLVNASLSPVPQSPAFLVEPGPVFDIECADVPIALIPTEYNAHGVISHVSVSGSKLSMLDGSTFAGLQIQGIRLSRDQLYSISDFAFSSMSTTLTMLDLSGNYLDELPLTAFKTLKLLEWLNLSNNLVNSLRGDWFSVPISLRKLLLPANSIDELPNKLLSSFHRLHWLDLSANFIKDNLTKESFPPNLQTLNLMKNRLTRFPNSVFNLDSLSWLFIGGCAIETIPQEWPLGSPPRQMNQLDLSENFIQVWPSKPFGGQLTTLDLSVNKNDLQVLPAASFYSMNIFRLSLGYNRIQMIDPQAFATLEQTLKYLNLENNRLASLPWASLINLTSLMHLYLGSNAIPDEGADSPPEDMDCKLTYLGLNGNILSRIPSWLLRCPHLYHLNLGYNQITNLDDLIHIASPPKPTLMSVGGKSGSVKLKRFRYLNTLILRNNPIRSLSYINNELHGIFGGQQNSENNMRRSTDIDSNTVYTVNQFSDMQGSYNKNSEFILNYGKDQDGKGGSSSSTDSTSNNELIYPSLSSVVDQGPGPTIHSHNHGRSASGSGQYKKKHGSSSNSGNNGADNSEENGGNGGTISIDKSGKSPSPSSSSSSSILFPTKSLASTTTTSTSSSSFTNVFRTEVFPNLHELSLSFCQLVGELEPFPSLPLTTLEISNGLKTATALHPAIFNSLRNLEWLALDHNSLSTISGYTFYGTPRISYVNLEFNRFETLPPLFHPDIHQALTQLRFSHNRLSTILSETFSINAINIDLSYNQISTIEKHAFVTPALSSGASRKSGHEIQSSSSSSSSSGNGQFLSPGTNSDRSRNRGSLTTSSSGGIGGGSTFSASASTATTNTGAGGSTISVVAATTSNDEHPGLNVYLNHNRLTTVKAGAFSQDKFNLIDLSYNFLSSFSLDAFGRRTIIDGLNVSHNSLDRLVVKQRWARNHLIKFLDLSHNRITVKGIDFTALCITRLLDLSHNLIDKTDAKIFPANCSLKELKLSNNMIKLLESGSFANLRDLTILDLSSNQIVLIPPVIFIRNTKLRYLDLSNNRIRSLPRDSLFGSSIEILNLSNNQFVNLPVGSLSQITRRLRRLDISYNSLEHLDSTMFENLNLIHLNLAHNRLSILPDNAFANLRSLRELDLSYNFIRANFKELFHFLPNLKLLRLSGCGIKSLPFLPLTHLISLDLSENGLSDIKYHSIGSLTKLRHLDLSNNELSNAKIPNWTPLDNLVSLKLSNNPLTKLTKDTFQGLGRLETLEIVNISKLDRFDSEVLTQLPNLRSLTIETHPDIEKYRFRLGTILSSIPHLEELKVIIKEPTLSDQLIGIQPKLRKLTITGEKLRRIESNALDGLENCFHIDLAITHTSIDDIPSKVFEKLQSAAWARLDLSFNKMTSLDSFAFYPSSNRSVWFSKGTKILEGGLILDGNEWTCDCSMVSLAEWMRRWLRESFQSHSTDNIPLVHSMYESLRVPTCTDAKGKPIPIIELYSDTMCHASALSSSTSVNFYSKMAYQSSLLMFLQFVLSTSTVFTTVLLYCFTKIVY